MPAPATCDELLDLIRKSALTDENELDGYVGKARAESSLPSGPSELAGVLVRNGWLTAFQAEQLLQGKWRRFTIGPYKVLERIGSGAMGSVYLCQHYRMQRAVAVKVLPTACAGSPSAVERFYREARALACLSHSNIVRAYDIDHDGTLHFIVMEYVDGSNLNEIVARSGPMNSTRAANYIHQAALGMQHAHEVAGLVHRDIEPGNLLVDRRGTVRIVDFGLARFTSDEGDTTGRDYHREALGTPDYMAPEQAKDFHTVDIRADIYGLGATLYFCLTGRPPFGEGADAQKRIWHQRHQPKPIWCIRPNASEDLAAIVERMMAKDPAQRFPTPQCVAEALAPWMRHPVAVPSEDEMPRMSPAARRVIGRNS
jgi:serine/threonine protein kinase